MLKRIAKYGGALLLALTGMVFAFIAGMRAKYPPIQNAARRFNKAVVNPESLETAGQPGAYASVIHHRGRTTGTSYATPIHALPCDDGFVIPLPFGTRADWLKNVLAARSATIVHDGNTYRVEDPEIVTAAVAEPFVPAEDQRAHRLFGVDQFLRVRRELPHETREPMAESA